MPVFTWALRGIKVTLISEGIWLRLGNLNVARSSSSPHMFEIKKTNNHVNSLYEDTVGKTM